MEFIEEYGAYAEKAAEAIKKAIPRKVTPVKGIGKSAYVKELMKKYNIKAEPLNVGGKLNV